MTRKKVLEIKAHAYNRRLTSGFCFFFALFTILMGVLNQQWWRFLVAVPLVAFGFMQLRSASKFDAAVAEAENAGQDD